MAVEKHTEKDPFAGAAVYRLRRDALILAVNEQPDENGTLGFVTGISSKHHLDGQQQ